MPLSVLTVLFPFSSHLYYVLYPGQLPFLEESEEIRLQLVELTVAILSADYRADECHAVADNLVKV